MLSQLLNMKSFVLFLILTVLLVSTFGTILTPAHNLTNFLEQRQKRSLIFQDRGSISMNIGPAINVDLGDAVPWRSFIYIFVLHTGQYPLPQEPTYPWDKWEELYARTLKDKISALDTINADDARQFSYEAIENYINRQTPSTTQRLGRQCLLRAICENAQIVHHMGIYSEVLNIILTPGHTKLHTCYNDAHAAGKHGVNCFTMYNECPRGMSFLDRFLDDDY